MWVTLRFFWSRLGMVCDYPTPCHTVDPQTRFTGFHGFSYRSYPSTRNHSSRVFQKAGPAFFAQPNQHSKVIFMAVFILVLYHIVNAINTPFNSQRSVSSCSAPLSSWSHLGLLSVVTYMHVSLVVDRSGAHTCRMCETIAQFQ